MKKFDVKAQKDIILGYSECSKAYKVYNSKTNMIVESTHIKFDDKEPDSKMSELVQNFQKSVYPKTHQELEVKNLEVHKQSIHLKLNA